MKILPLSSSSLSLITLYILHMLSIINCQSCLQNYQYYNSTTNQCKPCPIQCLSCFDSITCTSCNNQYYLTQNNTCENCPFGCSICTNSNNCISCIQGLYITSNGNCLPCQIGIKSCTISLIQSCQPQYFMLGSICAGCLQNCKTCQDFVTCILCNIGYYVNNNNNSYSQCLPCPNNCQVCLSSTVCTSCQIGYILNGSNCILPNCTAISLFCIKCTINNKCQQCQHGKYLNSNGICIQGSSLLCQTSNGPYYTNCQTNLYGCPSYSIIQYDLQTNQQLSICLPLHASQNQQFIYQYYDSTCQANNSVQCGVKYSKIYTFNTAKPYYKLYYYISLYIYNIAIQNITISYINQDNTINTSYTHNINISKQFTQNLYNPLCYNCKYGYTIIQGQLNISNRANNTKIQIQSQYSLLEIQQILIQTQICKVQNCKQCTTAIDCIQCNQPLFLQFISCVTVCDAGFYIYNQNCVLNCPIGTYAIQSLYLCQVCVTPCKSCSTVTSCLSCINGYYLDGNNCVTVCSSLSKFTNLTSGVCQPCPNPCTQCNIQFINNTNNTNNTNNSNPEWNIICVGCSIGYLLQQGNCTFLCPNGTFPNYINNQTQCTLCNIGCSSCAIQNSICFSCLQQYLLYDNTCYYNYICPNGYYIDNIINSCQKCHYPCQTCSTDKNNCTSCITGALYNGTCPFICPITMYIAYINININISNNSNSQVCQACPSPCLTCSSPLLCYSCINNTYLYNSQCYPSQCPTLKYYKQNINNTCLPCIPPCLQCINQTLCLSCTTGYIDLSINKCVLQCNSTSYGNINFICQLCIYPCISCYSQNICLACALPYVLYNQSCVNQNVCISNNMYIYNNYNQSNIYNNTIINNNNIISKQCKLCTYPCFTCNISAILCITCVNNYIIVADLHICVQICPSTYYLYVNSTNNMKQCKKCDSNCLQCNNTDVYCISCGLGTYLNQLTNTCNVTCVSQYYASNEDQTCHPCTSPCLQCYNPYLCKSCIPSLSLYYYNKACISICPNTTIINTTTHQCQPCSSNCLSCSILPTNCTQCNNNIYYYYNFTCTQKCPSLYYPDSISHNCQLCNQPCLQCNNNIQCISCIDGYYLLNISMSCIIICPITYYADNITNSCLLCNSSICYSCQYDQNNCIQCVNHYYYDFNSSKCVNLCPIGTYGDDIYKQCVSCRYPCVGCDNVTVCLECGNGYKLYNGYCYSNCPLGYYSTTTNTNTTNITTNTNISNNICIKCQPLCQICQSQTICLKCITNYYVNISKICVAQCQIGYYSGYDILTSYQICISCGNICLQCINSYNCTKCINGYYLFNFMCVQECPSLYFQFNVTGDVNGSIVVLSSQCLQCSQYCDNCLNQSYCLSCLNSYIYNNLCYIECPPKTFIYNQQQCINCTSPCLQCISTYQCLTCIEGYFYFINYCVASCPSDVWMYPNNNSCSNLCPYNKYVQQMLCYVNGCGGMLVLLNGYCIDKCPYGYYVDKQQNCQQCNNNKICNNIFKGDLQILRTYNLRACVYFNQLINPQQISINNIIITFTDKNYQTNILTYLPYNVIIDNNRILIQFGYINIQLYKIEIKIPYINSQDSQQSIGYNVFTGYVNSYNNYQYQPININIAHINNNNRLLTQLNSQQTPYNQIYKPNNIITIIATAIVICTFICLTLNIISKNTSYRQLFDFLQFVAATIYMQIQYPPILQAYLNKLRIILFSFMPNIINNKLYTFSSSKFIQYNGDSSILRSQGMLFIIFILQTIGFAVVIFIQKYRDSKQSNNQNNNNKENNIKQVKNKQNKCNILNILIQRIKYRNLTDLFTIVSFPLLIFCFKINNSQISDIIVQIICMILIIGFLIMISYILMTNKNRKQISGITGELQDTKNILGQMYAPFSFIRKIIFAMVICIQPQKPISNLTLLLIFTILIMVCLFFYEPFQNRITDFVSIGLQVALIIHILLIILFGLNAMNGIAGRNLGIATVSVTMLAAIVGLVWLIYLTFLGMIKYKKQLSEAKVGLEQQLNTQNQQNKKKTDTGKDNLNLNNTKKDNKILNTEQDFNDEPSANELMKGNKIHSKIMEQQIEIQSKSSQNKQEFRHWNNSQDSDQISQNGKPPKYLLKVEANKKDSPNEEM